MSEFTARNSEICRLRYEENMTLETIAARFDITRERVRQLVARDDRADGFVRQIPVNPICLSIVSAKKANILLSGTQLARQFGVMPHFVYSALKAAGIAVSAPLVDKFWKRVVVGAPDECWLWQGARNSVTGYGHIRHMGRNVYAHRVAFEMANDGIPDGLWVLHRCDNPPCVNPAHLFAGTPKDNVHDSMNKGRRNDSNKSRRGEKSYHAKITDAQALVIKRALASGAKPKELAAQYPISLQTIYAISGGYSWKWLTL